MSNSKYTLVTFIPHNIIDQFLTSHMNRYFLAVACLQLWREVSPVDPLTTWTPLIIALLITAAKALFDDLKRFYNDYKSNFKKYTIVNRKYLNTSSLSNSKKDDFLISVKSKDIQVGDIIKLEENDEIPSDCVLIQSANENGVSHVTTANMDGEVDLKFKSISRDLLHYQQTQYLLTCPMFVKCSQPNRDMYTFDSTLFLYDYNTNTNSHHSINTVNGAVLDGDERVSVTSHSTVQTNNRLNSPTHLKIISLSHEQLLCQSCHLKNVSHSFGLVVYTGNETKSGMNRTKAPSKRAQTDHKIDKMAIVIFSIQLLIAIVGGIMGIVYNETLLKGKAWFLVITSKSFIDPYIIMPMRFFLLTTYMIPISLKITIDFMKLIFSLFIEWDITLYDAKKDWACIASNSDICEDLGQVNYILSDKTGTLTENRMLFRKCSIFGSIYEFDENGNETIRSFIKSVKSLTNHLDYYDRYYIDDRSEMRPFLVTQFFTALALCHSCKRELNEYKSVSPDEECLVKACQTIGIELYETSHDFYSLKFNTSLKTSNLQYNTLMNNDNLNSARSYSVKNSANISVSQIIPLIDTNNNDMDINSERFDLLHLFKFTSDRKRMSVIVRDTQTDRIILYSKGADDKMISLMKSDFADCELHEVSQKQINEFSKTGLRTLLVGFKFIEPNDYEIFSEKLRLVSTLSEGREAELSKLYDNIESDLIYLGITAIEDELQEQVPQTIKKLRQANINIWMLTGDKQETAQQIALSCQLIDGLNTLHEISGQTPNAINQSLFAISKVVKSQETYAIIVNGATLGLIMQPTQHSNSFVTEERINMEIFENILMNAKSVICCRVTPGQKADIVSLVINHDKKVIESDSNYFRKFWKIMKFKFFKRKVVALALGDGQNDIPMIQKAHVGVGIAGNEGLQAARSADFAVGKFRHVLPLLFKHGHLAFHRTAMISQFSFYKNVLLALIQVLFNSFTGFSGMSIYNEASLALYNFVFTGIYIFTYVFDFNVRADDLLSRPSLYRECQESRSMNMKTFLKWILLAIIHACIILFFSFATFNATTTGTQHSIDKDFLGHTLYSSVLWTSVFTFLTYSNSFNIINLGVIIITMVGYYAYLGVYGNLAGVFGIISPVTKLPSAKTTYGVFNHMMADPTNYFLVLLCVLTCWMVAMAFRALSMLWNPQYSEQSIPAAAWILGNRVDSSVEIKVARRNQVSQSY